MPRNSVKTRLVNEMYYHYLSRINDSIQDNQIIVNTYAFIEIDK